MSVDLDLLEALLHAAADRVLIQAIRSPDGFAAICGAWVEPAREP